MPYSGEISRRNPTCFLFLVDQSASMADPFGGGGGRQKAQGLADVLNRILRDLILACTKPTVYDYFEVGAIGYGPSVGPAFGGVLSGRELVRVSELADNPLRIEERRRTDVDDTGRVVELPAKVGVWFDPVADNGTPMCEALRVAQRVLKSWVDQHPSSYPPTVVNITDGEATDGDPTQPAEEIMRLATNDGNALLYNIHISSAPEAQVVFPDNEAVLADQYAKLLFGMSSILPDSQRQLAQAMMGSTLSGQSRGFVFNADQVTLARLLAWGTTKDLR